MKQTEKIPYAPPCVQVIHIPMHANLFASLSYPSGIEAEFDDLTEQGEWGS